MIDETVAKSGPSAGNCPFIGAVRGSAVPGSAEAPSGCPVSAGAAAFDAFEGPYQVDPAETLHWSRDQEPVFYSPKLGYWVVSRYEHVKAIFRDGITFSPANVFEKVTPSAPEADAILARYEYGMNRTLVNEDEPAHMERRRSLMHSFVPEELAHHEPIVRRLTRMYVDRFIDKGEADLVDECLRLSGSIVAWRRLVTADTRVGDVDLPKGAKLLIVMASANHDPRHFENADELDIYRDNITDHLSFGYGSHQCMGKNLARMEMRIFLEEFTKRLPHMVQALHAIGVDVPCDCQEGLCGSCEVGVLAVEIDHRDKVLSTAERAENTRMMACCSRARDSKLVLAL